MNAELLGLFSGFPDHHFPAGMVSFFEKYLTVRRSIVFITTWPEDYVTKDTIRQFGNIHYIYKGSTVPMTQEILEEIRNR